MNRVQELIARYEDDTLDEAGQQELIGLLARDPVARRSLVAEWSLSSALARLLNQRAVPGMDGWQRHTARHLAARRRRHTRRTLLLWWPLATAATLLVIVGGWWSLGGPTVLATVVQADGGPAVGTRLAAGARMMLPADARVHLRLLSGSEVTLSDGADLALPSADNLTLGRGHAELTVLPRTNGAPPFTITSPHGAARVLGTSFSVHVTADETVVKVSHGRVQVERSDGASVAANPGERAVLRSDRFPVVLPVWRADQREALLVTGRPDLDAGERHLFGLLSAMGLRPRTVLAGTLSDHDTDNARLAVLGNRIALPDLEKRLRHPRCPLLILELGAWPLYGFPISDRETVTLADPLVADIARAHPLTAGLSAPVTLAGAGSRIGRGLPGSSTLLTLRGGGQAVLSVREAGERLPDGSINPQRRVAFFATTDALPKLTQEGEHLLVATLRWVAELE